MWRVTDEGKGTKTKNKGQREVEEENFSMHTWKDMMQLEITEALSVSAFRNSMFIHNY